MLIGFWDEHFPVVCHFQAGFDCFPCWTSPYYYFTNLYTMENSFLMQMGKKCLDSEKSSKISKFDLFFSDMNGPSTKRSDYLDWPDYFMAIAFLSAQRSKDPRTQVIFIQSSTLAVVRWPMASENWFGPVPICFQ